MSFKREGNDKGLLDSLRRRRVKELFGEDIPEDEAKLLCNGRFACLVCSHNPVFDTVNMLMVHRHGKKHAAGEEIFLRKKKELQALILKRKHEQFMKDGTTVIKQAVASSAAGIMASQPYDPRVKKHKVKPYERKPCLDLHSDLGRFQSSDINASSGSTIPTAVPTKHSHQLKNIFRPAQRTPEPVRPYVRQHKTFTDNSTSCHPTHSNQFPVSEPSNDHSVSQTSIYTGSHYSEPVSSTAAAWSSSSHSGFVNVHDASLSVNTSSSPGSALPQGRTFTSTKTKLLEQGVDSTRTSLQPSGNVCSLDGMAGAKDGGMERTSAVSHSVQAADKPGCVSVGGSLGSSTEEKKLAQKYYHLSGSGWKKDWDGKWIRDEEAEFDSDEEPPDLP